MDKIHSFHYFGSQEKRRCNKCNEIEGSHSEYCHTRESLLRDVALLEDANNTLQRVLMCMKDERDQLRQRIEAADKQDPVANRQLAKGALKRGITVYVYETGFFGEGEPLYALPPTADNKGE